MAAKVLFDLACSSFTVPLRWETSKIMTTGRVREAGEWCCVNRLSSETSLIFQLAPRVKYGIQIQTSIEINAEFLGGRTRVPVWPTEGFEAAEDFVDESLAAQV